MPFPQDTSFGPAESGKPSYDAFFAAMLEYLQNRRGPQNQRSALYLARASKFTDTEKPFTAANAVKVGVIGSGDSSRLRFESGKNTCDIQCPLGWSCTSSTDKTCVKTVNTGSRELRTTMLEAHTFLSKNDSQGTGPVQIYAYVTPKPPGPLFEGRLRLPDPSPDDNRGLVSADFGVVVEALEKARSAELEKSGINPTLAAFQERMSSATSGSQHFVYVVPTDEYDGKQFSNDSDSTECFVTIIDSQGNISNAFDETAEPTVCACLRIARNAKNFGGFSFSAVRGRPGTFQGYYTKQFVPDSEFDMSLEATSVGIEPCPPRKGCPKSTGWRSDCMTGSASACVVDMEGNDALQKFLLDAIAYFGADKQLSLMYYPGTCGASLFNPSTDYIADAAALVLDKLSSEQKNAYENRNLRKDLRNKDASGVLTDAGASGSNQPQAAGLSAIEIALIVAAAVLAFIAIIYGIARAINAKKIRERVQTGFGTSQPANNDYFIV